MNPKGEMRKALTWMRKDLDIITRKQYDKEIEERLINSQLYQKSQTLFIYVSYNNEVYTHNIIKKALDDNKLVCVPKVLSKELGMLSVQILNYEDLSPGKYGILEPKENSPIIDPKDMDLVILPGLAFDLKGGRLGYGAGFYDRFLNNINVKKYALGYEMQIIEEVPTDSHDILIDGIITNKTIHNIDVRLKKQK